MLPKAVEIVVRIKQPFCLVTVWKPSGRSFGYPDSEKPAAKDNGK